MELIRPLYYVREDDIKKWRDSNDLEFLRCACRFTERNDNEEDPMDSKRLETKKIIRELKKTNPYIEKNIFKSAQNVNLKTVLAYKSDGVKHFFTDDY
jgi:tRNA(Ile)-lysidine synthase TilS/MesJ